MNLTTIVTLITEIGVLIGFMTPVLTILKKVINSERCHLRSDMLKIYYSNREAGTIRQYEYENFVFMYEGYKALKGNSFIDKIYEDVQSWEIIS